MMHRIAIPSPQTSLPFIWMHHRDGPNYHPFCVAHTLEPDFNDLRRIIEFGYDPLHACVVLCFVGNSVGFGKAYAPARNGLE